jgi:RNA polymerase sigma-70 factor (ECF subfamily)
MNDLGRRLAEGDDEAFTEVVGQYGKRVYALCYRLLRNEEEARDMAQEVFVKVYLKRKSFKASSQVYTWIYRIALNMCFSALKARKAATVPLEEVEGLLAAGDPQGEDRAAELRALVARALEHLPPKQRGVFMMRFYDKLAFAEIAEAMGTSTGAAKANFHFAVERLRRILGEADCHEH